jgi:polyferredoxin
MQLAQQTEAPKKRILDSKIWRMVLVLLAGLLIFGAPYVVYISSDFLKRGVFFSFTGGIVSLVLGLTLLLFLVKKKVFF